MSRDADIVVLGAGVAGAATARALALAGRGVLVLERFSPGHARGSSHGTSRIFRLAYPDERFVRMAQAADAAWSELASEAGETLLLRTGSLDLGAVALDNARALSACGVRSERLTGSDVRRRWPLAADDDETALFQPDGGILLADRAYAALLATARAAGAELLSKAPARALAVERGAVRVSTERDEILARAVVVTAGAWSPGLLAPLGIDLPVVPTRETVAYLELPGAAELPAVIDWGRLPENGTAGIPRAGQATYALAAPGVGLKAGLHHAGAATDPDDDPRPEQGIATWATAWARGRYAGCGATIGAETCLYTNTADEGFLLERHGRVVVGSACSGHGFKFAPVVGRTLAALAVDAAAS